MKKFLAFVLALAMVMALAACGDNAGNDTGGGSDETVTLTLAHIRPVDSPSDVAIRAFAEEPQSSPAAASSSRSTPPASWATTPWCRNA